MAPPAPFFVLVVCTANICRSPLGAHLLRQGLADFQVSVASAGTHAEPGEAMCPESAAFAGVASDAHRAVELAPLPSPLPDLILVAEREHRAHIARLDPSTRASTFTLTQAAALSGLVTAAMGEGFLPVGAPALPVEPEARLRWLVAEMDAARGSGPARDPELDDIADTHGMRGHKETFGEVRAAVDSWLADARFVLASPDLPSRPSETGQS